MTRRFLIGPALGGKEEELRWPGIAFAVGQGARGFRGFSTEKGGEVRGRTDS
jgi:hypothetical protein